MDAVLAGLQWDRCLAYLDIMVGKTFQEHCHTQPRSGLVGADRLEVDIFRMSPLPSTNQLMGAERWNALLTRFKSSFSPVLYLIMTAIGY